MNPADVDVWRVVNDLFVKILSSGETLKVAAHFSWEPSGVEQLVFADGTVWNRATIELLAWFRGTAAAETITGTSVPDTIDGRGGDDILRGKEGSDTYIYGVGSGNDTIEEDGTGSEVDKLKLVGLNPADVDLWRVGNDLFVKILSSGETIKVAAHFSWEPSGVEQLVFADGTVWDRATIESLAWFRGTAAAETINGTDGPNTIDGRGGDDTLRGKEGSDTYIYGVGSGNDIDRGRRLRRGRRQGQADRAEPGGRRVGALRLRPVREDPVERRDPQGRRRTSPGSRAASSSSCSPTAPSGIAPRSRRSPGSAAPRAPTS